MIILANEALFERWKALAVRVDSLKVVVQNDMDIDPSQLKIWEQWTVEISDQIEKLIMDTKATWTN